MLASARLFKPAAQANLLAAQNLNKVPVRGMAGGQKQLKARIGAVTNVRKITKAMQMIASSKMRGTERKMHQARLFAKDLISVWPEAKAEEAAAAAGPKSTLYIPVTSDRGLCGSLNTGVTRFVKRTLGESKDPFSLIVLGEKGRAHLEREFAAKLSYVATDAGKVKPVTFREVSLIADNILRQDCDQVQFLYNKFVNSLTYTMTPVTLPSLTNALANRDAWQDFDFEGVDAEVLENLYEYRLAVMLFYFYAENGCSEMSARVNSMSNSSKNAGELVENLTLLYNRTRQGQVTTDLLEVISGALSVQTKK